MSIWPFYTRAVDLRSLHSIFVLLIAATAAILPNMYSCGVQPSTRKGKMLVPSGKNFVKSAFCRSRGGAVHCSWLNAFLLPILLTASASIGSIPDRVPIVSRCVHTCKTISCCVCCRSSRLVSFLFHVDPLDLTYDCGVIADFFCKQHSTRQLYASTRRIRVPLGLRPKGYL